MQHLSPVGRGLTAAALSLAVASLGLVTTTAHAVIAPGDDPTAFGSAMVSGAPFASASFAVDYPCVPDDPATAEDEGNCPTGVSTTPMAGFPTHGDSFSILTTGNAAFADDPNTSPSTSEAWTEGDALIPGVRDAQVARVNLGAATGNCLAFDFKFLSEEYPEFVEQGYNDAFVAQLNTWNVSKDATTQAVLAPGDFAAGAGDTISVDASGPSSMNAAEAAGTTYDGATLSLVARTPVAPGSSNTLFLTIFDQGDSIYDSAVFLDNLRYENIAPAQCKSLALDPFEGTTGISPTSTTPTLDSKLSTLSLPVACNLPPGPIGCQVTASATFTPQGQKVTPRGRVAGAMKKTTPLASGSLSLAAGQAGTLAMATTPEGVKAVQAEMKKPQAMKKQAKKLKKKSKKLKKAAAKAPTKKAKKLLKKSKKLAKKSKKLTKKAKQLQKQPLGTVRLSVNNAANGASEVITLSLKR